MIENGVMFQVFHWFSPADGSLWSWLMTQADVLAQQGVTGVWIPPAYKAAAGPHDQGYAVYDLFDLGEFDHKGAVRTKYGTKDQLIAAVKALRSKRTKT